MLFLKKRGGGGLSAPFLGLATRDDGISRDVINEFLPCSRRASGGVSPSADL